MHNLSIVPSPRRDRATGKLLTLLVGVLSGLAAAVLPDGAAAAEVTCSNGAVESKPLSAGQPDLLVTGTCVIQKVADYYYGDVRIIKDGKLIFREPADKDTKVDFWARNILVENGGALIAGDNRPYGAQGNGTLTVLLYGPNQSEGDPAANPGQGVLCHGSDPNSPCGIPKDVWSDNGADLISGCGDAPANEASKCIPGLAPSEKDYFYQYGNLYGDGKPAGDGRIGYFGYKTLAVSYGGTLVLNGHKGARYIADTDRDHVNSGGSWLRLGESLKPGKNELRLDHSPGLGCSGQAGDVCGWRKGDKIVVTTTDYLPGHSEELIIDEIDKQNVTFHPADPAHPAIQWHHNGMRFGIKERLEKAGVRARLEAGGMDRNLIDNGAETRAAVALLTRSIRIVSAGDVAGETFEQASNKQANCKNGVKVPYCYSFGAHTVFRQGFAKLQIQGVEFENLGQPGKLGHYPVHFHMARKTPADTYVKDSSVNESMTRWYVLHSTLGVTLARNVGYKSIGHGYYLEEGTEADNAFYANIGILARASLENEQNPRRVPGILSDNSPKEKQGDVVGHGQDYFPYFSDYNHPSVFWITNGWNDFVGNMAVGANACGACYWFVPSLNTDMPDVPTDKNVDQTDTGGHMKWTGYSGLQNKTAFAASTPLKSFTRNYCSSAMNSFMTVANTAACHGVVPAVDAATQNAVKAVPSFAPYADKNPHYYPNAPGGGSRQGTFCPSGADGKPDCSNVKDKCSSGALENCAVTVLDHYVSAFHWAEQNLSAVWLRNQWYLVDNSVLSDVQVGGLTFITGGDYTHSSVIPGYWAVAKSSLFIGHSQPQKSDDPDFNGYAVDAGPFNNFSGLKCDWQTSTKIPSAYCLSRAEGISMPLANFAVNQRLFNVYDGPAYQDGNAYFDITTTDCPITGAQTEKPGCMYGSFVALGVRKLPDTSKACSEPGGAYLPNAAVAWKQPNGFFYPPAFHSANLFFDNVDIRHYVVNPLFKAPDTVTGDLDFHQGGTYKTDSALAQTQFCTFNEEMFNGYSGIDRQTELSDDDGSLTGLTNDRTPQQGYTGTISINQDPFFAAPGETAECRSSLGISPDKACTAIPVTQQTQTARTSPYDYVAVAVEPECSQTPQPGRSYGRCGDDPGAGFGGYWSSECSNEYCYGIPLFRQLLTGNKGTGVGDAAGEWKHWWRNKCNEKASWGEPQCRWPFIRMAGANLYQRETLLANNGVFYLDTTIPLATQQNESFNNHPPAVDHRDVNLFEKNKTYYVYFLYAKPTTKLTLQIYVGNGFQPTAENLYEVRGDLASAPAIFSPKPDGPNKKLPAWLKLESTPVDANGVLTLSIDFTGLTELLPSAADLCQPRSFCKPEGNACVTALTVDSLAVKANPDLLVQAGKVCSRWAMKDLDCPRSGCLGFAFKLPDGFAANGQGQAARPMPISFADAEKKNIWPQIKFMRTTTVPDKSEPSAPYKPFSCYYKDPLPGTPDCSPADPN